MRLFSEHPGAAMSMATSPRLQAQLAEAVSQRGVSTALETGTYLGEGSTTLLAGLLAAQPQPGLTTIEANWRFWRKARERLAAFPFVNCLWGRTVAAEEALAFMQSDEALLHHERYGDVFIDNLDDPLAFYSRECKGDLFETIDAGDAAFQRDQAAHYAGDDLLRVHLQRLRGERPLILLDSAGGIGWLEFQITMEVMADADFLLLLDDVHHLKHFRSLAAVRRDAAFELLDADEDAGWALAWHHSVPQG
ncbi:MAG: hypothetical protein ACF8NJ_05115 [Phycisphaerales bacterium JB038]